MRVHTWELCQADDAAGDRFRIARHLIVRAARNHTIRQHSEARLFGTGIYLSLHNPEKELTYMKTAQHRRKSMKTGKAEQPEHVKKQKRRTT